jgi:hypothetical protein
MFFFIYVLIRDYFAASLHACNAAKVVTHSFEERNQECADRKSR